MNILNILIICAYIIVCVITDIKIVGIINGVSVLLLILIQFMLVILYQWYFKTSKDSIDNEVLDDAVGAARICFVILNVPLAVCILSWKSEMAWIVAELLISSIAFIYEKAKKTKYFSENKTSIHFFIEGYAIVFFIAACLYTIENISGGVLGIEYIHLRSYQIILIIIVSVISGFLSLVKNSFIARITSYNYKHNHVINQLFKDERERNDK